MNTHKKERTRHWMSYFRIQVTTGIAVKGQQPVFPLLHDIQDHYSIFKSGDCGTMKRHGKGSPKLSISKSALRPPSSWLR